MSHFICPLRATFRLSKGQVKLNFQIYFSRFAPSSFFHLSLIKLARMFNSVGKTGVNLAHSENIETWAKKRGRNTEDH